MLETNTLMVAAATMTAIRVPAANRT